MSLKNQTQFFSWIIQKGKRTWRTPNSPKSEI